MKPDQPRHGQPEDEDANDQVLRQLARQAPPPEPSPAAWDAVLARVAAALPPRPTAARRRRAWPWVAAVAGLAAAVVVAVVVRAPHQPPSQDRPADPPPVAVTQPGQDDRHAEAGGGDADNLTDLPLLSHDQVTLNDAPDPDMRLENWGTPMIVDPRLLNDP